MNICGPGLCGPVFCFSWVETQEWNYRVMCSLYDELAEGGFSWRLQGIKSPPSSVWVPASPPPQVTVRVFDESHPDGCEVISHCVCVFFLNYLFMYLFLAALGLRFCARAFFSCGKRGSLFIAVRGPFTVAASLVAGHRLQTRRFSSCGSRAQPHCVLICISLMTNDAGPFGHL